MYDLRRLRSLCAIADHGSLTAAADALDFTQPAVSQHLAALEAEAGAPLVMRSRGGAELTAAGQLLVEHARAALDRLALAELQVAGPDRARAAACPARGALVVADPARAARRRRPAARGSPTPRSRSARPGRRGRSRRCGAATSTSPSRSAARGANAPEDVEERTLLEESMYAVVPRAHPLAGAAGDRARRPARRPVGPGPVGDLARPDPRALPRRGLRAADRVRERRPARDPRDRRRRAGREPGPIADQGRHGARPQRRRAAVARPAAPARRRRHGGGRAARPRRRARRSSRWRAPGPGSAGPPV